MSRVAQKPIMIPEGVNVEITQTKVLCNKESILNELKIPADIEIIKINSLLKVMRKSDSKKARSLHGLMARLLTNLVNGVKEGFTSELEFSGTGYRAAVNSGEVALNMGYSHEIKLKIPEGISVAIKKNVITVSGHDKQTVGQFAAQIRKVREPEVYKGKGIKYKGEFIKRKAGKKAASA